MLIAVEEYLKNNVIIYNSDGKEISKKTNATLRFDKINSLIINNNIYILIRHRNKLLYYIFQNNDFWRDDNKNILEVKSIDLLDLKKSNYIPVKLDDDKWTYIDNYGKFPFKNKTWKLIREFNSDYAIVNIERTKSTLINKKGEYVFTYKNGEPKTWIFLKFKMKNKYQAMKENNEIYTIYPQEKKIEKIN